ncbi:biotin--[acetyl-CoA-carboxylase] ligase [uncultured Desulfobacter sp.]|uniref:biotin--[acetyl-CoA-carboxylase] ligase n=1 Tax=uncultured Desulfobacter sp. TaxID=240139 RepID=UPI002AAAE874|nr:biotin--[acetyl-CoA-carboxylase] ligase [uncultured Desulfobacter sp.]
MKVNHVLPEKRQQILTLLYQAAGTSVSGVKISDAAGISRVAVWKHIKALQQAGVDIESLATGYALRDPGNLLYPFCFPDPLKEKIFHFPELDSTMDKARQMARAGAGHACCVIAEGQTKSRGRLNRQWHSGRGGLWFTLILKPELPPPLAWAVNFAASTCMVEVLHRLFGLEIRVKWPNDLLLDGRKLCGMLSEMETRADMVDFWLLGIGLNVNNTPDSDQYQAIALKTALGKPVSRKQILVRFLELFESRISDIDPAGIISQWKEKSSTIGARVRIQTHDRIYEGTALDVDDTGTLMVRQEDGTTRRIIYGDCFYL